MIESGVQLRQEGSEQWAVDCVEIVWRREVVEGRSQECS